MKSKSQKFGLLTATSLVIGNMIGAGIFLLPSTLANYGSISVFGWIFTAIGALILAKIFSNFSKIIIGKSGGPYTFSKAGFGDFIGFLVAWGYWISCWVGNSAIAVAVISALSFFFPILDTNPMVSVWVGLMIIWVLTWVNIRGVKESGRIQVITTVLKILPLLLIIIVGAFFFSFDNFPDFNLTTGSHFATIPVVGTLTLYAFLGIECATIPAGNVKNPKVNVPKATMIGTLLTTIIYIFGTIVIFGMIPVEILQKSPAPFAEAGKLIGGDWAGYFVAGGAAVAAIGALNGWILITGQIPMATAQDNLFPKIFKKENKKGAPIFGLIIGSVLTSLVMLMNFTDGLVEQFEFMILLTTLTCLVPYLFVAAAYIIVLVEKKLFIHSFLKTFLLGSLGFAYTLWAIYGSGHDSVFYGFLLMILGIPFYVLMQWNKRKNDE